MDFSIDDICFKCEIDLSDSITIKSLNKNYDVFYSNKNLENIINETYKSNDFIFIDKNVYNLYSSIFLNIKNILIFDALERNKTIESVIELTDKLSDIKFTKNNQLIVIGGGITQDVGGFAASIYKRGINWIFIPTTLLSMTDSCIGSKVCINRKTKNILGMFYAPNKIFISDYFLNSLSNDDIISGIGESFKLSLIGGLNIYNLFIEKLNNYDYISLIKISLLVKKVIIEYDEFELHTRKSLNLGHTIGHAIESTTNYYIPHGISVLIGIYINNILFYDNKYDTINNFIIKLINPKFFDINFNYFEFINHILLDKKNKGNLICFIQLEDIGKSKIIYKNLEEINSKLKEILISLFKNVE